MSRIRATGASALVGFNPSLGVIRENDQYQPQQDRVQDSLTTPRQPTHDEVRVSVSTQEHQLEKQQRRRPDA
jgi:hypothetical protein